MPRSFRITSIEGPVGIGPLDLYYQYYVNFEFDPGEPFNTIQGRAIVHLIDREAHSIASGQADQSPFKEIALSRIAYFATEKLSSILCVPTPDMNQLISPSFDELKRLLEVDPNKVEYGDWMEVKAEIRKPSRRVFISCGQQSQEEIDLGKQIKALVEEVSGLEGYFAEYQNSLEGLTENIFNALYDSSGFISVMHRRDKLSNKEYRGSVWIEQEIAIASFIVQTLKISLPSRAYIQGGIRGDGVRGYIILNPIEFESDEDVIEDLISWLPVLTSAAQE